MSEKEKRLAVDKLIDKNDRPRSGVSVHAKEALKQALRSDRDSLNGKSKKNGADDHDKDKEEETNPGAGVSLSEFPDGPGPSDSSDNVLLNPDANDADYKVSHPTGDKMRDKVRKLLADAMDKKDESVLPEGRSGIEVVANSIESAMYKHFGETDQKYKTKYRDLNFNLKDQKNVELRRRVLTRYVVLDKLISMSNQELANDELKQIRKQVADKMKRDAQPSNKPMATTDQFKCGKCKQRKTTYFQKQTRSADEPMTTFVTCVVCGNLWKF